MAAVEPVPAASLILLRDAPLELLMIRRHAQASFVPGAWVFPGGATEEADRRETLVDTMRATAMRETFEETGISLADPRHLVWTSRWITPQGIPKRFDTWFFLARAPQDAAAIVDGSEAVDAVWITPERALRELQMVFPTIKNIEALRGHDDVESLLASRRGATIEPVEPILVNGKPRLP
jgi:8-oxo-dGTP pyrophosphatase MutT (NUDIX family)